eukprot:jgi/Mesvir1/28173/Mv04733-RA.1
MAFDYLITGLLVFRIIQHVRGGHGNQLSCPRVRSMTKPRHVGKTACDSRVGLFPYTKDIPYKDAITSVSEVQRLLAPLISLERQQRLRDVVQNRTFSLLPVVEGLTDMGNVSAVCRSAEGLGYGELHIVAHKHGYKHQYNAARVSVGSERWLRLTEWRHTSDCLSSLKERGYRVAVTHLEAATPIGEIDWTVPTAIVFGNERHGVSQEALAHADVRCVLPMQGLAESFNISVAAALVLYHAMRDRILRQGYHGDLTPEQRDILHAVYLLRENDLNEDILQSLVAREGQKAQEAVAAAAKVPV